MILHKEEVVFRDRIDAGKRLGERLTAYQGRQVVVFAIPRGGVPVATEVADKLGATLDVIISRKIPISFNPEAGYGAVTEDGAVVLNESLVKQLRLTEDQIKPQAEQVRAEIARRSAVYRSKLETSSVTDKTAVIIDDGLASGFTMRAAILSMQQRRAAKIVVAVPVASGTAYDFIKPQVDELVCLIVARVHQFAVASFYAHWYDLTDEEVIRYLEAWQRRHIQAVRQNARFRK